MKKSNFMDRIFPPKHDFLMMLQQQAALSAEGISALGDFLENRSALIICPLYEIGDKADQQRLDMEAQLASAFSTPFDRQDIYALSIEMDRVLDCAVLTMRAIETYEIIANNIMVGMIAELKKGMTEFARAIKSLDEDAVMIGESIVRMRLTQAMNEEIYRRGMKQLFASDDPMNAMKLREIYRYLRDCSVYLGVAVDRFHKIVFTKA